MSWSLASLFAQVNNLFAQASNLIAQANGVAGGGAQLVNEPAADPYAWLMWIIAIAVVILPFVAGNYLSKAWRMPEHAWRFGIVLFALTAGIVVCTLRWPPRLGIDLSGGVILVYELEDQQNKEFNLGNEADRIRRRLQSNVDSSIEVEAVKNQIVVRLPSTDTDLATKAQQSIAGITFADITVNLGRSTKSEGQTVLVYDTTRPTQGAPEMDKLVGALNKRINPGGQKEVVVRTLGERQIEIIIPQVDQSEIELIKKKISTAGVLEFRIVANNRDHADLFELADRNPKATEIADGGRVRAKWVKLDSKMTPEPWMKLRQNRAGETEALVQIDTYNITGDYLNRASATVDSTAQPAVHFSFNTSGAARFGSLTGENLPDAATGFHRHLGIILDSRLVSAPRLRSAISSEGQITGNFTQPEVNLLVEVLNAGHLPATLNPVPVSERNISPQLGEETIRNGGIVMIVSTLAILLFMGWYYRFSGMVANFAVVLNVLLVVSLMILLKAAFTLAGLAGLVLSVGMAVDANVLIFERMREEMQRGAALRMAIRNGFGRAMSTIIDSNITTLISAVVLYAIGTDQLKGFAITLILGLLLNLFTAVFVTRVIFDVAERRRWITRLNMVRTFNQTNFDFVKPVKIFVTASILTIAVGLVAAASRGASLFDIDFTGGTSLQIVLKPNSPLNVNQVRERLDEVSDPDTKLESVTVSSISGQTLAENRYYKIDTSNDNIEDVKRRLLRTFPEMQLYEMSYQLAQSSAAATTSSTTSAGKSDATKSDVTEPATKSTEPATNSTEPAAGNDPQPAAKAEDSKSGDPKTDAAKTGAAKTDDSKSGDTKTDETKSGDSATGDSKIDDTKQPDASKQDAAEKSAARLPRGSLLSLTAANTLLLLQAEDGKADSTKADSPTTEAAKATETKAADAKTESSETSSDTTKSDATKSDTSKSDAAKSDAADTKADSAAKSTTGATSATTGTPATAADASSTIPSATAADPFADGTTAQLIFAEGINREALDDKLKQALASLEMTNVLLELDSPEGTGGAPFKRWTVRTTSSETEAAALFDRVDSNLAQTPVFLAANKIGGRVAGRTQDMAIIALIASMLMIILYVWFRFQNVVFGVAAVTAVFHDVLVAISALAISSYVAPYFGWALINPFKISLDVVAALLTIIGFSINDTIVIFDRIREIRGKSPEITADMVNKAVNQTLGRTIITSGTVLIVTTILYIMGGQEIHPFAFTMLIGILSGTYSTVFIAAPMVLWFRKRSSVDNRGRMIGERQATRV